MNRVCMNVIGVLAVLVLSNAFGSCDKKDKEPIVDNSDRMVRVAYQKSDAIFPNPERGFYRHTECELGTGRDGLSLTTLKSYRQGNFSLILRVFYLKSFRHTSLSEKALEDFDRDMAILRQAGMKCILRFAYSNHEEEPDASLDIISEHLDRLKPYVEKNVDVIAVVQAGFIGAWGEWYYSSNHLTTPETRAVVLDKLLEMLPENRMIQVRAPMYKMDYLKRQDPLNAGEAFTGIYAARVGHHNDCFMASPDDYGTYRDVEAEKEYLNTEGLYVPLGGETCPPSGIAPADCSKAQAEMRKLRWTYLNEDYYAGVNDQWRTQGCMDNIVRELGYRFELISGEYSSKVAKGGALYANIKLINTGYAALFNKRPVELILKNEKTGRVYVLPTELEPRRWKPLSEELLEITVIVPADAEPGSYALCLNLPDAAEALAQIPFYSVRFANESVWEEKTGYNNLKTEVSVY